MSELIYLTSQWLGNEVRSAQDGCEDIESYSFRPTVDCICGLERHEHDQACYG